MLPGPIRRFLERRRFPGLLVIAAILLLVNLFVPDPLPFIDEALLLVATLLFGAWRDRRSASEDTEPSPDSNESTRR